jgi:hypothetical protein
METDGERRLSPAFTRNDPSNERRVAGSVEESLLDNEIFIGSRLVLAAKAKLGSPVVMRFDRRRIGHSVDRRNHD